MSYRVELSKTGRAGCSNATCKKEGSKIGKGELRQGVLVQIQEHQSMKWRHWGCVTPTVLHNWWDSAGKDLDLIDGYDELPEDAQEKVKVALEEGHVDDADWNGDIECNRYNEANPKQGMFLTKAQKKKMEKDAEGEDDEGETKKPAKKRSRKQTEVDEDDEAEAKPAKKPRAKKAKAEEEDEAPAPAKKASRKKAPVKEEEAQDSANEDDPPAPKKSKGRKPKAAAKVEPSSDVGEADEAEAEEEDHKPVPTKKAAAKPRKGRAKKAANE